MLDKAELHKERKHSIRRGLYWGFKNAEGCYEVKYGYPLTIYGLPHSGKSEMAFEILLNLAELYGHQFLLFTPESGTATEVANLLIGKHVGKPVHLLYDKGKENKYAMTDDEFESGIEWFNKHFCVIDREEFTHEQITLSDIYSLAKTLEVDSGWHFRATMIDPKAEIYMDLENYNGREDLWLAGFYNQMREYDRENNHMTVLVEHVQNRKPSYDKSTQIVYHTMPSPTEMSGGQMHFRKGFNILCVFRPQHEIFDTHENETWLYVQKIKPRGAGKAGEKISLFWDGQKEGRYYEIINGEKYYARPKESRDALALAVDRAKPNEETPF